MTSLDGLHPLTRIACERWLAECRNDPRLAGIMVICTWRGEAEQASNYAKGRTAPGVPCTHAGEATPRPVGACPDHPLGATVTFARPGQSWHCVTRDGRPAAMAWDFCFTHPATGKPFWPANTDPRWLLAGAVAERLGLTHGIRHGVPDWDLGHIQHDDSGRLTLTAAKVGTDPQPIKEAA